MSYSTHEKALALIPKIPSVLSLIGSLYIFQHIIRSPVRRSFVYHRIMLGMSCSDIIGSIAMFLGTWPAPRDHGYLALGNEASCNLQGAFNQAAALGTPLYSGALAIYFLLTVRYGWREKNIKKYEVLFHGVPLVFAAGTGIAGWQLKLYNFANWICWIGPQPECSYGDNAVSGLPSCDRGRHFNAYRWAFLYAIVWCIFVVIAAAMLLIYTKVRSTERASRRYDPSDSLHMDAPTKLSVKKTKSRSQEALTQALLYVSAFYLTWVFGTVARLLQLFGITSFPVFVNMLIFFPLQGFFNAFIYFRPRYMNAARSFWCCLLLLDQLRNKESETLPAQSNSGIETAVESGAEHGEDDASAELGNILDES